MTQDELKNLTVTHNVDSTVTISGEVPFSYLEAERKASIKYFGKDMEIDGFRKGHVPENMVVERVGEMTLLTDMAERALAAVYPKIVEHNELDIIGYPQISITKIAMGNPLGFKATVAIVPEVKLPDYLQIAKDVNTKRESSEVTDEEVTKQIEDILRQKQAYERLQKKAAAKKEAEESGITLPTPDTVEEASATIGSTPDASGEASDEASETDVVPELTDDFVKTLGQPGQFDSVADFKNKIREHLTIEKAREVTSAHRAKLTDAIIEKSEMVIPKVMIEAELNQMFAQMEEDLNRAQLKMDDYLGHIKKTREDLMAEWTPAAEKRAKLQLVLNEIAKKEEIKPDAGSVDHEVSHLLEHYKDADERRVRTYVESVLTNEAVLKKLEGVE